MGTGGIEEMLLAEAVEHVQKIESVQSIADLPWYGYLVDSVSHFHLQV